MSRRPGLAGSAAAWTAEGRARVLRLLAGLDRPYRGLGLHAITRVLVLSSLIGLVAGLGAILFQTLCQLGLHLFLDRLAGYDQAGPPGESPLFAPSGVPLRAWALPLVPALGALLSGWLVLRFAPEAGGHGTDAAVDSFHRRGGRIRGRVPIVKTLASALTLGSGGSGGREGPIAQIGAGFGSFLATRLGLSERERRVLLAAGVGAGVGSIFRAPLAGALFAAEVLYSDPEFESEVIIPAGIAAIIAYCVFSLRFGFGSLFETPDFAFRSAAELVPYTVLALVVALGARAFVTVFYGVHHWFERLRVPPLAKPVLGGLGTGALGLGLLLATGSTRALDVMAFGYGTLQDALTGQLGIGLLLAIAGGKMLTTALSIGSGGSGGVFGPSMVIGGSLGGAVGLLAQRAMPDVVQQPGAFVAVGMAGFFSAAANTPISTLVMVSEMTGNYQLLLPSLWVCSLAYLAGRPARLYRSQVPSRAESPAYRGAILQTVLRGMRIADVIADRPVRTVPERASLEEVVRTFVRSSQHCLPVVDAAGRMTGVVWISGIRDLLDRSGESSPIVAGDLATAAGTVLRPEDDLDVALRSLVEEDVEELPVTAAGDPRRVVGLLSRRDLLAAYNVRRAGPAAPVSGVPWAESPP